ncbi:MAG: PTS sugar transporter subunit IIB [Erysipelotrichaceae bacterium]|nr:PTS sugar transporter subunit IIB [Erysipelotrichaceae bacterium]
MDEYKQDSGILDVRVDDRMVHGIVATQWIPAAKATRAMVVNKRASESNMTRQALKLGTPAGVNLSVLAPEKAITNILNGNYRNQRVFVVGRYIKDVYDLYKGGVKFARVNLGNVTQNIVKTKTLDKTVRVSEEELAMLKEMKDAGIRITCQFRVDDPCKDAKLD